MFDKEYIKRVCDLSLNEEDYSKSQILIKYDLDKPFNELTPFQFLSNIYFVPFIVHSALSILPENLPTVLPQYALQ